MDSVPHNLADLTPTVRAESGDYATVRGFVAGQTFMGRFRLERLLGQGGMGVVWLAYDLSLGESIALKFISDTLQRDTAAIDDLKSEARKARQLTHAHIIRIHEFWQDEHAAAVSMEFVDGRNLSQLRLEQPDKIFQVDTLAPWIEQLCEALSYAHQKARLVHRDLKPANLLIDTQGELKVADFGISATISETTNRLSKRSNGGYTEAYASPQQFRGQHATPLDDIYSVGATLYELLTSKPPFYQGNLLVQVERQAPQSLSARRAELGREGTNIPSAWEQTILACLAKDPKARPQSANEISNRLGLSSGKISIERGASGASFKHPKIKTLAYVALGLGAIGCLLTARYWLKSIPEINHEPHAISPSAGQTSADKPSTNNGLEPQTNKPHPTHEFIVNVVPVLDGTHVWLGPYSYLPVNAGKAVLRDVPDGDQVLTVQAPGCQLYIEHVTVSKNSGVALAKLLPNNLGAEVSNRAHSSNSADASTNSSPKITVDMPEAKLIELKGSPDSTASVGSKSILRWNDLEAVLIDGKVAGFKLLTPKPVRNEAPPQSLLANGRPVSPQPVIRLPQSNSYPANSRPANQANLPNPYADTAANKAQQAQRLLALERSIKFLEKRIYYYDTHTSFDPGGRGMTSIEYEQNTKLIERYQSLYAELQRNLASP